MFLQEDTQRLSEVSYAALEAVQARLPFHRGCTCDYSTLPWHGARYVYIHCGDDRCGICLEKATDVLEWIISQLARSETPDASCE